jgi:hypothetical protein
MESEPAGSALRTSATCLSVMASTNPHTATVIGAVRRHCSMGIATPSRKGWTSVFTALCEPMSRGSFGLAPAAGTFVDLQRHGVRIAPRSSPRKAVPNTLNEMPQERRRAGVGSEVGRASTPSLLRTGWSKIPGFIRERDNIEMEPTLLTVRAIVWPRSAAHFARYADNVDARRTRNTWMRIAPLRTLHLACC